MDSRTTVSAGEFLAAGHKFWRAKLQVGGKFPGKLAGYLGNAEFCRHFGECPVIWRSHYPAKLRHQFHIRLANLFALLGKFLY